ncbi:glycosyltransferase family 39 protein [Microbacterium sp. ET2]|uniref:glycosyltransferase family 39 protein n=1 Tax=Microbacterium albipurpureum TaxID=3050384 RepID=UPI00259CBC93|nr:glycosyltransferase family 39 protein [Microbacterium sp. ET2 (Ac-2212)]WJL97196.1 glycosyltransferase family 39 protein [Microbacterium sp. ET2 (Ac-2212)]
MTIARHRLAVGHVVGAMVALIVVLALISPLYGYHRDELYFRMLPLAWGYTDQPPLAPLLVHGVTAVWGDSVVAVRIIPIVCAAASLPLLTLITREVGGSRLAQAFTAWGVAGATMTLMFGHVFLTASLDLVVWPATLYFVIRAVLREEGCWWLVAGAIVGASSFNKLLIVVLLIGVAIGLAICGPRQWFRSGWLYGAVVLIFVLALPNLLYQATHGWPQFAMGAALGAENAAEVRTMMWPFLVLLVGPVLAVFWVTALVALFRRTEWRPLRWLAVTLVVTVVFVFLAATQFYYSAGILGVLTAMGSVPIAEWARTRARRLIVSVLLAVNALGCAVTSLPLLPVDWFGASGLASVNSATADQVGWERYVEQIDEVAAAFDADAIIASNYGEAGALDRFGSGVPVFSGHNALFDLGAPPPDAQTVVIVGGQYDRVESLFSTCRVVTELDNGVGVENEEQGEPVALCSGPNAPWEDLWPQFRHLD